MDDSVLFSLRLSIQVAVAATLLMTVSGITAAYFLARKAFRGREFLDMLVTLPLVLPPTVTGYYLIILFGRNGLIGKPVYQMTGWSIMFTWYAAVLASFVVAIPLLIKTARAAIESVDKNLVQAAYALGLTEFQTALHIILPLAKRGIIAGVILSFARALGEFGATLMIAGNIPGKTDTMPLSIYMYASSGDWSKANMMVIAETIITGLMLYLANRFSK
ncbi:MAG: molybdenum ABC transporter permease subunit [Desulfobacteraceae bacterium IS3]|nr:MAG: molybdenum ABC transporter permease subunit [Desulfobacteraceae bacterium IS3]